MKKMCQCSCQCKNEEKQPVEPVQEVSPVDPAAPLAEPECCGGCDNCNCDM